MIEKWKQPGSVQQIAHPASAEADPTKAPMSHRPLLDYATSEDWRRRRAGKIYLVVAMIMLVAILMEIAVVVFF